MLPENLHLNIGSLVFEGLDQIDLTGPFEVLSSLPNSTYRVYGLTTNPIKDIHGFTLMPDAAMEDAPQLDILHVPGGKGQEALMDNEAVLEWLRRQSGGAKRVLSVCTGALLCGAAGLIKGKRATTHWASFEFLQYFGAIPVNERVVVDGNWTFAAGVTAGIDGALTLAADVRGEEVAKRIQLEIAYAPEPPFNSGTPETAPPSVVKAAREAGKELSDRRLKTAKRIAEQMGIKI